MSEKGRIVIEAALDASGVKDGLERIKKEGSTAVGKLKLGFTAAGAAIAAVTAGTVAVGKAAITAYADYEQLAGGIETLFGDSSATMMRYADEAYKTAGMSANAYMETVTGFSASLLQSLGGDTQKATEAANQAVIDMADNANKMGTDIEMIQNAYQGFAKQNFTMLDNLKLGYGGTKEEMQRLLDKANEINERQGVITDYQIDNFADIVEAIHVVQDEMGITGTTAAEASDTISGSMASAKAAWTNLLIGIADGTQDTDVLVSNFVDSVCTVAENLLPRIGQVLKSLVKIAWQGAKNAGKEFIAGLWDGITGSVQNAEEAALQTGAAILAGTEEALDIHSPSKAAQYLGEMYGLGLAAGVDKSSSKAAKAAYDLAKKAFDASEDYIENASFFGKMNLQDELAAWERVRDRFIEGSEQRIKAEKEIYTLQRKISRESFENSEDYIDRMIDLGQMSLAEELAAWERVQQRYLAGSDERIKADKKVYDLRKKLADEVARLEADYADALSDRTAEIMESFDLFEAAPEIGAVSVGELLGDMRNQQAVLDRWVQEMAVLAARGLNESFVQAVRDKGPDALGELLALNKMTDEQIAEYAGMWQSLNEQAQAAAATELAGLREETDRQIAELLGGVEKQFVDEAPDVGEALSDGLAAGIIDGRSRVINAAAAVAAAAVRAAKKELDINSPSRKFRYLGQMTDEGFVVGINDGMRNVQTAVGEIFKQTAQAFTPVAAHGAAAASGITREVHNNTRTVEKVAHIEGDGLTGDLIRLLRLRLKEEDRRVGLSLVEV